MSGISVRVLLRYLGERSYDDFRAACRTCGVKLVKQNRSKHYRPLRDDQVKALLLHYRAKGRGARS